MLNQTELNEAVLKTLKCFPHRPFLCLPLSATIYAILKDDFGVEVRLVTGDLAYDDSVIFKQDFKIEEASVEQLRFWSGHAWVEFEDYILDLSFFRTLYSVQFQKSCKSELIAQFGKGRGAIFGSREQLQMDKLFYRSVDNLKDETANSIIKGVKELPIWDD